MTPGEESLAWYELLYIKVEEKDRQAEAGLTAPMQCYESKKDKTPNPSTVSATDLSTVHFLQLLALLPSTAPADSTSY